MPEKSLININCGDITADDITCNSITIDGNEITETYVLKKGQASVLRYPASSGYQKWGQVDLSAGGYGNKFLVFFVTTEYNANGASGSAANGLLYVNVRGNGTSTSGVNAFQWLVRLNETSNQLYWRRSPDDDHLIEFYRKATYTSDTKKEYSQISFKVLSESGFENGSKWPFSFANTDKTTSNMGTTLAGKDPDVTDDENTAQTDSACKMHAVTYSGYVTKATTATNLATARTISLTGDTTGSASFNGSANASIATTTSSVKVTGGRPTNLNVKHGDGKLYYYVATSSATTGKPPHDAEVLHLSWDNTGGYDSQLAVANTTADIYVRSMSAGTWTDWIQLASQSWVSDNYVTKDELLHLNLIEPNSNVLTIASSDYASTDSGVTGTYFQLCNTASTWAFNLGDSVSGTYAYITLPNTGGQIALTSDLDSYETKTDATSKYNALNTAISGLTSFKYSVVTSLPTTGTKGTIYLVADSHSDSDDVYDEYLWIGDKFEKIGNTDVDLSDYLSFTKNELVSLAGSSRTVYKISPNDGPLYLPKGAVIGGTAAEAGFITRGISGIGTPDSTGAANKDSLYLNYDGSSVGNTYSRAVVLGAGGAGNAISASTASSTTASSTMGNLYSAVRGDQMVNYVTAKVPTMNAASADVADSTTGVLTFNDGCDDIYGETFDGSEDKTVYVFEKKSAGNVYTKNYLNLRDPTGAYSIQLGEAGLTLDDGRQDENYFKANSDGVFYEDVDVRAGAGSADTSSKIFLIGATSQTGVNSQTYSQDTAYVGTDGRLYSNSKQVVNLSDTQTLTNKTITAPYSNGSSYEFSAARYDSQPFAPTVWHDRLAFSGNSWSQNGSYKYELSADGSTFTTSSMDVRMLFAQREAVSTTAIPANYLACRFTFGSSFAYSNIQWLVIGYSYMATCPSTSVLIEHSTDNSTWTTLNSVSAGSWNQKYRFIKMSLSNSSNYLRITITKTTNTGYALVLNSIQALTIRPGNQGMGKEYSRPFYFDGSGNVIPWGNSAQQLGTSSKKWSNVYATTFTGTLSGNATTATTATKANAIVIGSKMYSASFDSDTGTLSFLEVS